MVSKNSKNFYPIFRLTSVVLFLAISAQTGSAKRTMQHDPQKQQQQERDESMYLASPNIYYHGNAKVKIGHSFSVTCIISIAESIEWYHNGRKVNLRDENYNATEEIYEDNPNYISARLEVRKAKPEHEGEYKCNRGYQNKFTLHIASPNIDGKFYTQHHHHHTNNNQQGTSGKHGGGGGVGNSGDNISHNENRSTIEQHKSKNKHEKKMENGSSLSTLDGRLIDDQFSIENTSRFPHYDSGPYGNTTLDSVHQTRKSHDKHSAVLTNYELHLMLPTPTALHSLSSDYNDQHEFIEDFDETDNRRDIEMSKKVVVLNDNLIVETLLTTSIIPLMNEFSLIETTAATINMVDNLPEDGIRTTTPTTLLSIIDGFGGNSNSEGGGVKDIIKVDGDVDDSDRMDSEEKFVSSVSDGEIVELKTTATTTTTSTVSTIINTQPTVLTKTLNVHTVLPKQADGQEGPYNYKLIPDGVVKDGKTIVAYDISHPINLVCKIETNAPNSTVLPLSWKKNNTEIEHGGRFDIKDSESRLQILKSTEHDAGDYTCTIKSQPSVVGTMSVQAKLVVFLPQNTAVVEEEKLEIHCKVKGNDADLKWFIKNQLNDTFVEYQYSDDRIKLSDDETGAKNAILTIESVSLDDRGDYKCNGTNPALSLQKPEYIEKVTFVRVKGKLAALWPFLGICAEVFVLCAIILIYEKRRNKQEAEESDTDSPELKNDHQGKDSDVRQRNEKLKHQKR